MSAAPAKKRPATKTAKKTATKTTAKAATKTVKKAAAPKATPKPAVKAAAPAKPPAAAPVPVAAGAASGRVEVCPRCGTATFGPEERTRWEGRRTVRFTVLVCERGHTFAHPIVKGA